MGIAGWAKLDGIDPDVSIQAGPGNVITGTFEHVADTIIDLQIEGQTTPIGCTGNHPFWSVDRQDFVAANELQQGERVQLLDGSTRRVVQISPRAGAQKVYNLEVYSEHAYLVTQDGILVHNAYDSAKLADNMLTGTGLDRPDDVAAHHMDAINAARAKDARDVIKKAGIEINDAENGVFVDSAVHHHMHTKNYYDNVNGILTAVKEKIEKSLDPTGKTQKEIDELISAQLKEKVPGALKLIRSKITSMTMKGDEIFGDTISTVRYSPTEIDKLIECLWP